MSEAKVITVADLSPMESWRCSLQPIETRLEICEGAVVFERNMVANLRHQLATLRASTIDSVMVPKEQLKKWHEVSCRYWFSDSDGESYNNDDVIEIGEQMEALLGVAPK